MRKIVKDEDVIKAKLKLGKFIAKKRENLNEPLSQSKLANAVGLPRSNMKYIEDGFNAPSPHIYMKLIETLKPTLSERKKMDGYYTTIRKSPPPDICEIINSNQELFDVIRLIKTNELTKEQIEQTQELFKTFVIAKEKGELENE